MHAIEQYNCNYLSHNPPEQTTILLLEGMITYGRTGNNLIEFFHALQYGREHNVLVGIMRGSWSMHMITEMWKSNHESDTQCSSLIQFMEQHFCVKVFYSEDQLHLYKEVIRMSTKELFFIQHTAPMDQYVEYISHVIRTLWRSYNTGTGVNMRRRPVRDMCSVMDAIFGADTMVDIDINSAVYSVVHSRSFEMRGGGSRLMNRIASNIGCDPVASLEMKPDYVKGILEPLGMMNHPIYFISDHEQPDILDRLLADPEIGPNIRLIPEETSWIGGDMTLATLANVFIGSPASTFAGFIAKSRVALGYNNNYLFLKQALDGTWVEVCDHQCVFDKDALGSMV